MSKDLGGFATLTGLRIGGGKAEIASRGADGAIPALSATSDGTPLIWQRSSLVSVAQITALPNRSTTTTATVSGVTVGDVLDIYPTTSSGFSNGVVVTAYPSAVNTATLVYSNVSGSTATLSAGNVRVLVRRFV